MNYTPWTVSFLWQPHNPFSVSTDSFDLCSLDTILYPTYWIFNFLFFSHTNPDSQSSPVPADSTLPANPCLAKMKIPDIAGKRDTVRFWWMSGGTSSSIMILAGLREVVIYYITWKRACSASLAWPENCKEPLMAGRDTIWSPTSAQLYTPSLEGQYLPGHQTSKPFLPQTSRKKCQAHLLQQCKSPFMLAQGISNKFYGISLEYLQTAFSLLWFWENNADIEGGKKSFIPRILSWETFC